MGKRVVVVGTTTGHKRRKFAFESMEARDRFAELLTALRTPPMGVLVPGVADASVPLAPALASRLTRLRVVVGTFNMGNAAAPADVRTWPSYRASTELFPGYEE